MDSRACVLSAVYFALSLRSLPVAFTAGGPRVQRRFCPFLSGWSGRGSSSFLHSRVRPSCRSRFPFAAFSGNCIWRLSVRIASFTICFFTAVVPAWLSRFGADFVQVRPKLFFSYDLLCRIPTFMPHMVLVPHRFCRHETSDFSASLPVCLLNGLGWTKEAIRRGLNRRHIKMISSNFFA